MCKDLNKLTLIHYVMIALKAKPNTNTLADVPNKQFQVETMSKLYQIT